MTVGCTDDSGDDRADRRPAPETAVVGSLDTLPPIRPFEYSSGATDVVVQLSTSPDGRREFPLLTVYGDGTVVNLVGDEWRTGTASEFTVQSLLVEADDVGLLDEPIELRALRARPRPDITATFQVEGARIEHRLDLARIERPDQPRAFLERTALQNVFELTEPYRTEAWLTCPDADCEIVDEQQTVDDRPMLPHEDRADLEAAGAPPPP